MAAAASNHWEGIFVGREDELSQLISAWNEGKQIFGVNGNKYIGKTRLVNELLYRLGIADENVYRLDYNGVATLKEMIEETKRGLCIECDLQDRTWTKCIASELKERVKKDPNNKDLVVFIKHYGDIDEIPELKNEFVKLCDIVKSSKRIRIVFTSTLKIRFANLQALYKSLNLWKKLSDDESKKLLMSLLHDSQVNLEKHEETIIRLCEGLPHSLMIVANDLKEQDGMVSPEDIALLLQLERLDSLSQEHYAENEQMRHVIGNVISKLPDGLGQSLAELNLLPESFDKTSGKTVVGAPNTAMLMHKYLLSLTRRGILNYDSKSQRFYATGMQRELVSNQLPISEENSADVNARLVHLYQERLQKFVVLPDIIQTSLRHHAHMALHSSEVFPNFAETVAKTNLFCCVHLSNGCVDVSEVMLAQCVRPEGVVEEGIPLSLLAKVITEQKGEDSESLQALEDKVETLSSKDGVTCCGRELAELYQAIGSRYVICGNKDKALAYLKKSHDLLVKLSFTEDFLFARSMNFMGFASALCGQWLEALTYMLQCVQLRVHMLGEGHIAVAIQCHNIELLFRQMKESNSDYVPFKLETDCSVPSKIYAMCLYGCAELFLRMQQPKKAREVAEEGISICIKNGKKEKELTQMFHDVVTNAYIRANKFQEANGLVYAEHDADELEKQILREMASEQNCSSKNLASETKPCSNGITQVHLNEISQSSERIPRQLEKRERSESDFSPSRSLSGCRSSNGYPQSVVRGQHCHTVPSCGQHQERQALSHTGHQGSVDLVNHNNTPHPPQVIHQSHDSSRRLGTSTGGQSGFNGQTYKWQPSSNENRSDYFHSNHKVWSSSYPTLYGTNTANETQTLSPVESSWPSDSQNHSVDSSMHSSVNLDQCVPNARHAQREPYGIPSSRMGFRTIGNSLGQTQADPSSSPSPCLVSDVYAPRSRTPTQCTPLGSGVGEIEKVALGPVRSSPEPHGIVGSLGISPGQKVGENDLLVHDHARPNSRGEFEPRISLLGGASRQQIQGRSLCPQSQGQSQQHISYSASRQTFRKEPVSGFQQQMNSSNLTPSPLNNVQSSPQYDTKQYLQHDIRFGCTGFPGQGPLIHTEDFFSDSSSCKSPISSSHSENYFIDPPHPSDQYHHRQMVQGGGDPSLQQNGPSHHQIDHRRQLRTSSNSTSHQLLYYPPDTSWNPTPSQIGANSVGSYQGGFNTQEGYAGHFFGQDSRHFNQSAPSLPNTATPSPNPSLSSSGPREMLLAATSRESQVHTSSPRSPPIQSQDEPLSSSAPVSRKLSFTGILKGFGFLSSSVPSKVEEI